MSEELICPHCGAIQETHEPDQISADMCWTECERCGKVSVRYNAYPSGLPDSGWVEDWKYKDIECDLCHGEGYTEHEYKPRMVQDGWE